MPQFDEWVLAPDDATTAAHPLRSEALGRLALRRAAASGTSLESFLHPTLSDLHDGELIAGMPEACTRIEKALRDREQILIYGDYDVDGVTSIVLLTHVIRALGGNVDFVVPHRLVDGYGLKLEVLERVLAERDVKLVVTVDCGITSIDPVERALERGIDVIITDHHLPPGMLPAALAVLNPHQEGCIYPFKDLAGVGVAFKLACTLLARNGKKISIESLLKIAALGTIADVAPLIGENRAIARVGLDGLGDARNLGLRALLRDLGLLGKRVSAADVGFKIGPRINAAGRLASADTAIHLFSARSDEEATQLVVELNQLNSQRQGIEREILAQAEELIGNSESLPSLLIFAGKEWHKGVLGLCAGRLAQRFHRPTLVISERDGECVGSGRSIAGVNLHALLGSVGELFTHFGGHEFACGFSFKASNLDVLRAALMREADAIPPSRFVRRADIESALSFSELDASFLEELMMLEPFGAGNRRPMFLTRGAKVGEVREFSPGCWSVMLRDGEVWHGGVLWPSSAGLRDQLTLGSYVDVIYSIDADRYGRNGMRLEIVDIAGAS